MKSGTVVGTGRIHCGKAMSTAAKRMRQCSQTDQFAQLFDRMIGGWRFAESIDRDGAYKTVREAGNNLYVLLAFGLNRIIVSRAIDGEATLAMAKWLETLSVEESRDLLKRVEQACG